jgi:hypothetical protein
VPKASAGTHSKSTECPKAAAIFVIRTTSRTATAELRFNYRYHNLSFQPKKRYYEEQLTDIWRLATTTITF